MRRHWRRLWRVAQMRTESSSHVSNIDRRRSRLLRRYWRLNAISGLRVAQMRIDRRSQCSNIYRRRGRILRRHRRLNAIRHRRLNVAQMRMERSTQRSSIYRRRPRPCLLLDADVRTCGATITFLMDSTAPRGAATGLHLHGGPRRVHHAPLSD